MLGKRIKQLFTDDKLSIYSDKGAYYRADYTFVVTKNGVDETIPNTVYKTCT